MSFQLMPDQMAALFGANWSTLTQAKIDDADPSSIVGQALAADDAIGAWRTAYLTLYEDASDTIIDADTGLTTTSPKPEPVGLTPGDEVRLGIAGLGEQRPCLVAG